MRYFKDIKVVDETTIKKILSNFKSYKGVVISENDKKNMEELLPLLVSHFSSSQIHNLINYNDNDTYFLVPYLDRIINITKKNLNFKNLSLLLLEHLIEKYTDEEIEKIIHIENNFTNCTGEIVALYNEIELHDIAYNEEILNLYKSIKFKHPVECKTFFNVILRKLGSKIFNDLELAKRVVKSSKIINVDEIVFTNYEQFLMFILNAENDDLLNCLIQLNFNFDKIFENENALGNPNLVKLFQMAINDSSDKDLKEEILDKFLSSKEIFTLLNNYEYYYALFKKLIIKISKIETSGWMKRLNLKFYDLYDTKSPDKKMFYGASCCSPLIADSVELIYKFKDLFNLPSEHKNIANIEAIIKYLNFYKYFDLTSLNEDVLFSCFANKELTPEAIWNYLNILLTIYNFHIIVNSYDNSKKNVRDICISLPCNIDMAEICKDSVKVAFFIELNSKTVSTYKCSFYRESETIIKSIFEKFNCAWDSINFNSLDYKILTQKAYLRRKLIEGVNNAK